MEKVDEKVDEEEVEEDEVVEVVKEVKKPTMKVKVNKNIAVNELEDIVIKEVKKPEVKKPNVINIMDEDNDNDEIPINTNRKDKRPLRIPNKKLHIILNLLLKD
jgi:hypothetical protein